MKQTKKTIGLITYDIPHKKTQDIMLHLLGNYVHVIAVPFKERKTRKILYPHRPSMHSNVSTKTLCKYFGFKYTKTENPVEIIKDLDITLIGGCGIIDSKGHKIINAHPGYLPYGRGLDALKWSIYRGEPLGVTTHLINDEVDSGYLIEQQFINIGFYDSFYSVAMRQYELEINMLVNSIEKAETYSKIDNRGLPVNKRMPIELEPIMMERFNLRRAK